MSIICDYMCSLFVVLLCGQHETWSVGRLGRHEKRGGGEITEDEEDECKEAEIEIVENRFMFSDCGTVCLKTGNHVAFFCECCSFYLNMLCTG